MSTMRQKFCDLYGMMFHDDCDMHPEFESFEKGYQAATEAAKATGTAGERPALTGNDVIEMIVGHLVSVVGGRNLMKGEEIGFSLDDLVFVANAAAARQPAPALPVKTWQERIEKDWQSEGFAAMQSEIAELRALLASQDKILRDSVPMHWKDCTSPVGAAQSYIAELESTLAATAAPVLSQAEIHRITIQEARKIGGGLVDEIPADDLTALGRAITERVLAATRSQP